MERFLVLGETPLARRIEWYLRAYATAVNAPHAVARWTPRVGIEHDMTVMQNQVWGTLVGQNTQGRPQVVVNAHEVNDLVFCESNVEQAWTVNTIFAAMACYAAKTAGVPFLQVSSEHVFRGDGGPYRVEDQPRPVNVYGVTKWYAEALVRMVYPMAEDRDPLLVSRGAHILRTSTLYGRDVRRDNNYLGTFGDRWSTFSFIGEVAFLIARNLLMSSRSIEGIIHVAPKTDLGSWSEYSGNPSEPSRSTRDLYVNVGRRLGLSPSVGWYLSDGEKALLDSRLESGQDGYIRYWNERYWNE